MSKEVEKDIEVVEKNDTAVIVFDEPYKWEGGSLTANYSLYKPQALIKTGFQSYFFVNSYVIFCSYL